MNLYSISNRKTINLSAGHLENDEYFEPAECRCVKTGTAKGFMNKGKSFVAPYDGRYGKGFVVIRNYNARYIAIEYWV